MAHHSSTLTHLITSSDYEKKSPKMMKFTRQMRKHDEIYINAAICGKSQRGETQNEPLWQHKIVYPTTIM